MNNEPQSDIVVSSGKPVVDNELEISKLEISCAQEAPHISTSNRDSAAEDTTNAFSKSSPASDTPINFQVSQNDDAENISAEMNRFSGEDLSTGTIR